MVIIGTPLTHITRPIKEDEKYNSKGEATSAPLLKSTTTPINSSLYGKKYYSSSISRNFSAISVAILSYFFVEQINFSLASFSSICESSKLVKKKMIINIHLDVNKTSWNTRYRIGDTYRFTKSFFSARAFSKSLAVSSNFSL